MTDYSLTHYTSLMRTPLTDIVAANVRAELARAGVPQMQLAAGIGLSQTSLSARLRGKTPFDVNEVGAIADFLGIPISSLIPAEFAVSA